MLPSEPSHLAAAIQHSPAYGSMSSFSQYCPSEVNDSQASVTLGLRRNRLKQDCVCHSRESAIKLFDSRRAAPPTELHRSSVSPSKHPVPHFIIPKSKTDGLHQTYIIILKVEAGNRSPSD